MTLEIDEGIQKYITPNVKADGFTFNVRQAAKDKNISVEQAKELFRKYAEEINKDYLEIYGKKLFVIGGEEYGVQP